MKIKQTTKYICGDDFRGIKKLQRYKQFNEKTFVLIILVFVRLC